VKDETKHALDFAYFKKSLIRIAIMSRQYLGGEVQVQKPKSRGSSGERAESRGGTRNKGFETTRTKMHSRSQKRGKVSSKELKAVDDLEKKKTHYGTKVRDIHIAPEYNVETISTETLDNLMKFLDLVPNENTKTINMKFHSRQMKKVKPTKDIQTIVNPR
jgi:hypothetical protein